ncbi:MAG: tetratricopeptide repeat protein [Methylocystis sp.]
MRRDLAQALSEAGRAHGEGRLVDAEHRYMAILKAHPTCFDALHFLGIVRSQQGRDAEALAPLRAALALHPRDASALSNFGLILRKMGRVEEALACIDKALELAPNHAEALNNRGNALTELGRPAEALESYEKALEIRPGYAEALNNRGSALRDLKRGQEALASYERALKIRPDHAATLNNRGVALQDLKRLDEALASYDHALKARPGYAEALNNRGLVLLELNRPAEALASYERALDARPGYGEALYNRGWTALLMGDFETGWAGYEHRWNRKDAEPRRLNAHFPNWTGEDPRGKRIVVYEEQGLGDVIHFSRYLPLLAARGASVSFLVCAPMHRLLRSLAPTIRLVDAPPAGETFDFQCALASLPLAFKTTPDWAPANVPYLFPEAALATRWRARIGDHGFRIGVCWQGNPLSKNDVERFVPLRCFAPIAAIPGARLISLQKTHGLDQLADLPAGLKVETLGEEFDGGPDAFVDAAAAMSCLDLIVTADTAVEHLAGALGRPVFAVHKLVPDWRWMLGRSDSPWYPTMTLYRQERRGDWDEVFARVAADVAKLAAPLQLFPRID